MAGLIECRGGIGLNQDVGKANSSGQEWLCEFRARLKTRGNRMPETKARLILALWPEIREALDGGQSLRTVRGWLEEEGVAISYGCLSSYVSRIRRRQVRADADAVTQPVAPPTSPTQLRNASERQPDSATDPLRNVRDRSRNRPGFEYPPGVDEDGLV